MTRDHTLLPASRPTSGFKGNAHIIPTYSLLSWSLGRGSVVRPYLLSQDDNLTWSQIWRIWPAVLLYTLFASGEYFDLPMKWARH